MSIERSCQFIESHNDQCLESLGDRIRIDSDSCSGKVVDGKIPLGFSSSALQVWSPRSAVSTTPLLTSSTRISHPSHTTSFRLSSLPFPFVLTFPYSARPCNRPTPTLAPPISYLIQLLRKRCCGHSILNPIDSNRLPTVHRPSLGHSPSSESDNPPPLAAAVAVRYGALHEMELER